MVRGRGGQRGGHAGEGAGKGDERPHPQPPLPHFPSHLVVGYPHYYGKHGRNPTGFLAYAKEQVSAFRECERQHASVGHDACPLLFELLGVAQEKVYYHCDQVRVCGFTEKKKKKKRLGERFEHVWVV